MPWSIFCMICHRSNNISLRGTEPVFPGGLTIGVGMYGRGFVLLAPSGTYSQILFALRLKLTLWDFSFLVSYTFLSSILGLHTDVEVDDFLLLDESELISDALSSSFLDEVETDALSLLSPLSWLFIFFYSSSISPSSSLESDEIDKFTVVG